MQRIPSLLVSFFALWATTSCSHFAGLDRLQAGSSYRPSGNLGHSPIQDLGRTRPIRRQFTERDSTLKWPVKRFKLTQAFSPVRNPSHQGLDMSGLRRSPVYAAHSGVVVYAGQGYSGYGKMVLLEYDGQWATLYAHFDSFAVRTGDRVTVGEVIGRMGRSGRATGVHLHFELLKDKQPVNPLPYLKKQRTLVE